MVTHISPVATAGPDRLGGAARRRELHRRRLPVIIALSLGLLFLHLLQWGMERSAQGRVERVQSYSTTLGSEAGQVRERLESAPRQHPQRYLTGLSLDGVPALLEQAEADLQQASRARHPAEKDRLAERAQARLREAQTRVEQVRGRLDRLDTARASYEEAARLLAASVPQARAVIASQERAGYRTDHFAASRALIEEAEQRLEEVRRLQAQSPGGTPPYLEIWEKGREGQERAAEAVRLARAVEELRQRNETRIRELIGRIDAARSQYDSARYAAARLAVYSAYGPLVGEVHRGRAALDAAREAAGGAARANSMERQAFREAADLLTQGERRAGAAADAFARAIETERLLAAALAALLVARAAAEDDLQDARRRIERYDDLDQDRALRLYNAAASRYRQAETLRHADPIAAVGRYREARRLAEEAYQTVRTSQPSGGGGSGGGGGWGGGGGSSGPSGGSYGGPSGGSYGGGGF